MPCTYFAFNKYLLNDFLNVLSEAEVASVGLRGPPVSQGRVGPGVIEQERPGQGDAGPPHFCTLTGRLSLEGLC